MIGYHGLVARLRTRVPEVSVGDVVAQRDTLDALIDIRESHEVATGFIPGAVHVPRGVLESAVERLDRSARIVLYCSGGNRSVLAAASLQQMGFTDVSSMAGGSSAWRMAGLPISMPGAAAAAGVPPAATDSTDRTARHARHLVMPEIGPAGQDRLDQASVLIVGAGGLGSPAALYLAAAGVGRIGIVDPDVVDVSNLQRQILHDTGWIGRLKVESAADRLTRLDPALTIETHPVLLEAANAAELIATYDVVIDASDNFPTRYLLNDAVMHTGAPLVHGSVFRFEGQASVFLPHEGPCYRCLFPLPPPPELAPDCATAGVLGSVTGIIGAIQATEAIKLIVGTGTSLAGTLLTVNTLDNEWNRLEFTRDPACPTCSDPGVLPRLTDYDASCRVPG
jgi:molybdopterin/thiamine biosynthesis adenylyltransferase/rhodanese-related sulfurtransferase